MLVLMPPELKAKRSVFVRKVDEVVGKQNAEDIKEEIERQNSWLKVDEVIKIKDYTHVFKLTCEDTHMADRIKQQGFLAFNVLITPEQIKQEIYTNLLTCFNCYTFEKHPTKDCPNKNNNYCSTCGQDDHTFRDCENTFIGCLNCKREGKKVKKPQHINNGLPNKKGNDKIKNRARSRKRKTKLLIRSCCQINSGTNNKDTSNPLLYYS